MIIKKISLFKVMTGALVLLFGLTLSGCSDDPLVLTIEFDTRGGTPLSAMQITEEEPFNLPTPSREGYDFIGWHYQNQIVDNQIVIQTFLDNNTFNIYLFARWEEKTPDFVSVRFINSFGSDPETQLIEPGSSLELPELRDSETHEFVGWYLDETLETAFTASNIHEDTTLYARFEEIKTVYVSMIEMTLNEPLRVHEEINLEISISPEHAASKAYSLLSSDPSIVEIIDLKKIRIHQLGTVTLTAIALDQETRFEITLNIERYGIRNQNDLDAYFESGLSVDVLELIQTVDTLTIQYPLFLNLDGRTIQHLKVESLLSGEVRLENGTISDTFIINAPSMRVINELTVQGPTTIQRIGMSSFISEGRHTAPITIEGSGRIELNGTASTVPLFISTTSDVILDGQMNGAVTVSAPGANVQIDGAIRRLNMESSATLTVRNNASVGEFNPGLHAVKIELETTAQMTIPDNSNVTTETIHRVYVSGIDSPRGGYFRIPTGARVDFIERTPIRIGHQFLGWYLDNSFETPFNFNQTINEDTTLYAKWQINTYQVRFQGVETPILPQTVNYGSRIPQPQVPPKEGHRFVGWFLDAAYQNPVNFSQIVDQNIVLYARYELNTFTVSFRNVSLENQTIQYNQRLNRPSDPNRTGHRFIGWFSDASMQSPFNFNQPITQNVTLHAGFEINTYTVFFSGAIVPAAEVNFNQTLARPANPSKEGHTFIGWFKDPSFEISFNFSQPILESTTVYASFEANTFRVNFHSPVSEITWPPQTVAYNQRPVINYTLSHENYLLEGWYLDSNFTERFDLTHRITQNTTLYARLIENEGNREAIIHFMNVSNDPLIQTQNSPINLQPPTREGYQFMGWFEDSALTIPLRNVLNEKTLQVYARFDAITFNVRFEGAEVSPQTVRYDARVFVPATPRKEGHRFVGWYQEAALQTLFNFQTGIRQNTIIYAKFESLQHRVQFVGTTLPDQLINAQALVVQPDNPARVGHDFIGWYQNAAMTQVFNFSTPMTENTLIYAKWEAHQFTVQFNPNDSNISIPSQRVSYNQRPSMPTTPLKEGYTFEGWYTNQALTNRFTGTNVIQGPTTLFARWIEEVKVFIHFNNIDRDPLEVIEGTSLSLAAPPVKEGYDFRGWYEDELFTIPLRPFAPGINLNVYAFYEIKTYTVQFETANTQLFLDERRVEHGQIVQLPPVNVTGFDFIDWYLDGNYSDLFSANTEVTNDMTLYGKFNIHTFSVNFQSNIEGTQIDSQSIDYLAKVTHPNQLREEPLAKEGYQFNGWFEDEAFTKRFDFDRGVTQDLTLYAKWDVIVYPVIFNSQGFITTVFITHGSILSPPTAPVRLGHRFEGWFLSSEFLDLAYAFSQEVLSPITLYAKWNINTYTVTYLEADGETIIETQNVTYNAFLFPPDVSLPLGQQLSGWTLDDELLSLSTYKMPAENITVKAVVASSNSLLVTVERFTQTSTIVQVEIWFRGTVEINAYDILIEFNPDHLSYSNHQNSSLVQAINTSVPSQIRFNYSDVSKALTTDTMIIRIEFNRLNSSPTQIDVTLLEGYFINSLNEIILVEGEPIPLTMNE